jgi:Flp pilus assembly protein TadB
MTDPTRAAQDRASREALLAAKQALIQDTQKQQEDAGASSPAASRLAFPLGISVVALALVALLVMRPACSSPRS